NHAPRGSPRRRRTVGSRASGCPGIADVPHARIRTAGPRFAARWEAYLHADARALAWAGRVVALLLVPLAAARAARLSAESPGVLHGDGPQWIRLAYHFDLFDPATLVDPFYNLGWPGVLAGLQRLDLAVADAARVASLAF